MTCVLYVHLQRFLPSQNLRCVMHKDFLTQTTSCQCCTRMTSVAKRCELSPVSVRNIFHSQNCRTWCFCVVQGPLCFVCYRDYFITCVADQPAFVILPTVPFQLWDVLRLRLVRRPRLRCHQDYHTVHGHFSLVISKLRQRIGVGSGGVVWWQICVCYCSCVFWCAFFFSFLFFLQFYLSVKCTCLGLVWALVYYCYSVVWNSVTSCCCVWSCCHITWHSCHGWLGINNLWSKYKSILLPHCPDTAVMVDWALQIYYLSINLSCCHIILLPHRPDTDVTVDWALQIYYLSINLSCCHIILLPHRPDTDVTVDWALQIYYLSINLSCCHIILLPHRPDTDVTVDWALQIYYLSINLSCCHKMLGWCCCCPFWEYV